MSRINLLTERPALWAALKSLTFDFLLAAISFSLADKKESSGHAGGSDVYGIEGLCHPKNRTFRQRVDNMIVRLGGRLTWLSW
jgi:hypothetical protein